MSARTDLGDVCTAVSLAFVFSVWGMVRWASPRWWGKRRHFRQWEQQMNENPEEKQP